MKLISQHLMKLKFNVTRNWYSLQSPYASVLSVCLIKCPVQCLIPKMLATFFQCTG